jgi:hypothetical protein
MSVVLDPTKSSPQEVPAMQALCEEVETTHVAVAFGCCCHVREAKRVDHLTSL